jgi:hypothetical protein
VEEIMRTKVIVVALFAAAASLLDVRANDTKPARRAPAAQRAKNMTELYLETMPGVLPGGVPIVPTPVTPLGSGGEGAEPTPAGHEPKAPVEKPSAPTPDPVPSGEAPPPAPSGPVSPPPSGQFPCPT